MGQIGTEQETIDVPRPIRAPQFVPTKTKPELPDWVDPNKQPEREPVPVRRGKDSRVV